MSKSVFACPANVVVSTCFASVASKPGWANAAAACASIVACVAASIVMMSVLLLQRPLRLWPCRASAITQTGCSPPKGLHALSRCTSNVAFSDGSLMSLVCCLSHRFKPFAFRKQNIESGMGYREMVPRRPLCVPKTSRSEPHPFHRAQHLDSDVPQRLGKMMRDARSVEPTQPREACARTASSNIVMV